MESLSLSVFLFQKHRKTREIFKGKAYKPIAMKAILYFLILTKNKVVILDISSKDEKYFDIFFF